MPLKIVSILYIYIKFYIFIHPHKYTNMIKDDYLFAIITWFWWVCDDSCGAISGIIFLKLKNGDVLVEYGYDGWIRWFVNLKSNSSVASYSESSFSSCSRRWFCLFSYPNSPLRALDQIPFIVITNLYDLRFLPWYYIPQVWCFGYLVLLISHFSSF